MRVLITFACISMLVFVPVYGVLSHTGTEKVNLRAEEYNPNSPPKTFEDLFFPHWFENGTYTFTVPEYMHRYNVALTNIWAKYYQYGAEKGRPASLEVYDDTGVVYWSFNNSNSAKGAPVGGPGRYHGTIKGNKILIKITGKSIIQFGVWGSWFENILEGGTYNITFPRKTIALYMDYYNPTNKHTFYFKASQPVYAYLFGWDGKLLSYTSKPVKEGYVTEPYDASPFLVFEQGGNESGNITVQFWMGYTPENETDYSGVFIVLGVFVAMASIAYIFSRKSIYGTNRRRKHR